jgi:hypothetical protein
LCSPLLNNDPSSAAIPAAIPPSPPPPAALDGLIEDVEPDEEVDPEEETEAAEGVPEEAAPVVSSGAPWTVGMLPVPVGIKTFTFGS